MRPEEIIAAATSRWLCLETSGSHLRSFGVTEKLWSRSAFHAGVMAGTQDVIPVVSLCPDLRNGLR